MIIFFRSLVLAVVAFTMLAAAHPAVTQSRRPLEQRPADNAESPAMKEMERRRAREANKQRQLDLKRDTDRLLQLATELKLYVDKSDENMLSLDVLRKAEEIEKLAKSVKTKMRGAN